MYVSGIPDFDMLEELCIKHIRKNNFLHEAMLFSFFYVANDCLRKVFRTIVQIDF